MLNNTTFNDENQQRQQSDEDEDSEIVINGKIMNESKRRHLNEADELGLIGEFDIGEALSQVDREI